LLGGAFLRFLCSGAAEHNLVFAGCQGFFHFGQIFSDDRSLVGSSGMGGVVL